MGKTSSPKGKVEDRTATLPSPTAPPTAAATSGQDFTLLLVSQLHTSVGELNAKVDHLIADVASQSTKIEAIRTTHAWVYGGFIAISAFIAIAIGAYSLIPVSLREAAIKALFGIN